MRHDGPVKVVGQILPQGLGGKLDQAAVGAELRGLALLDLRVAGVGGVGVPLLGAVVGVTVNRVFRAPDQRLLHLGHGPEIHIRHPHGQQILPTEITVQLIPLFTMCTMSVHNGIQIGPHRLPHANTPITS